MSVEVAKVAEDSARGGFFLVVGNVFATLISAVGVFLLARLLGPELYGVYTLSIVVPSLFLLFADLGIDQSLIRFSARLRAEKQSERLLKLIRYGLLFKLLVAAVVFSICFLLSDYLSIYLVNRPEIAVFVKLASIPIIFQAIFSSITSAFVGLDLMEYGALLVDTQATIKVAASLLLVILGFGMVGAITGFVVSYLVACPLSAGLLFYKSHKSSDHNDDPIRFADTVKKLLSYSFPIYLSTLLAGLMPQIQSIVLAFFASDFEIGNFKASYNFITLMSVVAVPVSTSIFQAFSKLDKKSENARTLFKLSVKYTSLLIVPMTILIVLFAKEVIEVVYGSSFLYAPFFLTLYASIYFFVGLGSLVFGGFFNGLGDTRTTFKMTLVAFVFFVFLAPLAAKSYGVQGLIIAYLISYSIFTMVGLFSARSRYRIELDYKNVICTYLVALVSAFPALSAVYLLQVSNLIKVLLIGLIYLFSYITLITLARVVTKAELESLERVIERLGFLRPLAKPILSYVNMLSSKFEATKVKF